MKNRYHIMLLVFLGLAFAKSEAFAHESRPLFIQIEAIASDSFTVKMNIPASVGQGNIPILHLPSAFKKSTPQIQNIPNGILKKYYFSTQGESLQGQVIQVEYPSYNPVITSIFQIENKDKSNITKILAPSQDQFTVPSEPSTMQAIKEYIWLGVQHIWEGIDHLLFVACLVLIAGFSKQLFWAITGFTLAHSITLCLAALDLIRLPLPPIEACIALSIVFLCYEITHHHQSQSSLTYRYPIAVSSSFGLLHGLGFASVLSDIGLPNTSKVAALLSFNIGVEVGQILFIGGLFLLAFILKKLPFSNYKKLQILVLQFGIYTIGIIAAYWFFDRIII